MQKAFQRFRDWTGIFAYTDAKGEYHTGKTLWDWLGLLIVPAVLAVGALWFNQSQAARTLEIELDRAREETLHSYLTEMEDFLLNRDLLSARESSESAGKKSTVLTVAQVKTVTVLRTLNRERREIIYQFLRDSGLADFLLEGASLRDVNLSESNLWGIKLSRASLSGAKLNKAFLVGVDMKQASLNGADLSEAVLQAAQLSRAYLSKAVLIRTDLIGADLSESELDGAVLTGAVLGAAKLSRANLREADLSKANLTWADLSGADLSDADLSGAFLIEADLSGAKVSNQQLASAKSLAGAIMPDGKVYDPAIHTFK